MYDKKLKVPYVTIKPFCDWLIDMGQLTVILNFKMAANKTANVTARILDKLEP